MRTYDVARMAHTRRAADLSYEQVLATREIEAVAEPIIAEFATALLDMRQQALETACEEEQRNPLTDSETGARHFELWNNRAAIIARSDALLAAFHAANAMKSDPNQDDIRDRLATLVEDLPDAGEMSLVYKPPLREPSRHWPNYEEQRAEQIGMHPEDLRRLRRGPTR